MMFRKIDLIVLCCLIVTMSTPGYAKNKKLSTQQIKILQTKEFESGCEPTFKAVQNALQDNNMQIQDADKKAGFVYATTGKKENLLLGIDKSVLTSVTFEDVAKDKCLVRSNFFEKKEHAKMGLLSVLLAVSSYGVGGSPELSARGGEEAKLLTDEKIYQRYYQQVEKHLFIRENLAR